MSSAVAFTLDDLATQEGDSFELSSGPKELIEAGLAYQVHIKSVACKATPSGYLQAELALEFTANGNSAGRQWVMLPVITKEKEKELGPEKKHKNMQVFGKNFHALLRAIAPETYSSYKRLDKSSRNWRFLDENDEPLSAAEKKQRDQAVATASVKAAIALTQGDAGVLTGADVWLVITETPSKNPKYPKPNRWLNWFAEQPEKFPAAELKDDGVPF